MTKAIIYHNPSCSKCRQTLELLQQKGCETEIIEYLKTPPSKQQLKEILALLKLEPRQLMRTHEAEYQALGLDNLDLDTDQLIDAMVNNPKLIERPIIISNGKATIGRPPVNVLDIL